MTIGDEHVFRQHGPEAPAVIGADYIAEREGVEPPQAYLPSKRVLKEDTEVTFDLRGLADGRLAVLAYSSLDSLVACCGELQPWASLPKDRVEEVRRRSGADLVIWDAQLPEEQRNDGEEARR
ncbi:SAV_915 family protein [Actinopolyspora mortivallis]|uniref:SAV_915 family protein n=1 Tax=Actinopolyspora mortivallis TaxID=33906 RepID=UPI00036B575A|nr:SAV_915 family protein [Actinopolyspora mortivallis]